MADDVAITAGAGTAVATDDIGGRHFQRVKNTFGPDGTATDVSATTPLPAYPPDITATGTISATDAVVGVHAGAGVPLTGTPTANSYVLYPIQGGESGFTLRLAGTFGGGTVWIESSPDSTNGLDGGWVTNVMRQSGITTSFVDADITAPGIFRGVVAGYAYVRVRVTGATTPSITVTMRGSRGPSVTAQVAALPPGTNTIGMTGNPKHASATKSNWTVAAASGTVLAANTARQQATFWNDGTATVYLDFTGGTASATSCTVKLLPDAYYEMPNSALNYTGAVTGIGSSATGTVRVTEWT
jgi:hypothetical protein